MLDSLGGDYTLAPSSATPPDGSIAVVTGFERDLLSRLGSRPASTSLVVITPPDALLPASELADLRVDAVVPAASIAEVAIALRRLPAPADPPTAPLTPPSNAASDAGQDLPWWIRPAQDTPPAASIPAGQPPHDTAVLATSPLPAFGQPVGPPTETLAMGVEQPSRRRFALTRRQAQIASILAVVIAMAVTAIVVGLNQPSSANAASNSPLGSTTNGGGNNTSPFGNSNGSNGSNGFNGSQGNGTSPQFGNQNPFSGQSGQNGTGTRRAELEQFLACLKQNGVTINGNNLRSLDPSDPKLRTALTKCASLMPFGRFRRDFGGSTGSTGTSSGATNSNGTNGSHTT